MTAATLALLLGIGCDYSVWLSEDLDGGAALDAPAIDAPAPDVPTADAPPRVDAGGLDAGPPGRACESVPAILATVRPSPPLEEPTFAVSGRLESLRYGVLVPPSSSATPTEDTRLIVADREGVVVAERALRIESGGAPASSATLHALPAEVGERGFVVLGPEAIWLLDPTGAGDPIPLATPPSPRWQRTAGWVDAARFAFVTETSDLRLAVLERTTGVVSGTPISATGAGCVHVEPGGVTISREGPTSETVVYGPGLDGVEVLRTTWDDGGLLGGRLLAAAMFGGVRTWVVRDFTEFRTAVTAYRVDTTGSPVPGAALTVVAPITGSLEETVVAVQGSGPALALYSLATGTFTTLPSPPGPAIVEAERDGERVAVLAFRPDATGGSSLELSCGVR